MNKPIIIVLFFALNNIVMSQPLITPFENDDNYSASYHECIAYYHQMADAFRELKISEVGPSDLGLPIYEVVIEKEGQEDNDKVVMFINNAIHPGEPCGVDASMMFARDLCTNDALNALLDNVIVVINPYYNIGGGLNRGSSSRANQDGPKEYGFRGNARNLDLNRDFVKCDSKNAQTFNRLFNKWCPEVFIDNHTSNGADYQYVMTLIATQKDKLGPNMSKHLSETMLPKLYADMANTKYEMTPYVYARETPDHGIMGFLDSPRYSTGYAALHHSIGFMPETHMLKPFKDRVWSTYEFMKTTLQYCSEHTKELMSSYDADVKYYAEEKTLPIHWTLDEDKVEQIAFKGFESGKKKSEISGKDRLYYDRNKPYEKEIPFLNEYVPAKSIEKPKLYIIPQAYDKVIDRLLWNGVNIQRLNQDTLIKVSMYYIKEYETVERPYEGHYLHYNTKTEEQEIELQWYKGDYIVEMGQSSDRYIVETLEPEAADSFFAWNFFDGVLMQKEYFSDYVFEDRAADLLQSNPDLKAALETKKANDSEFAEDARAQLRFIYEQSPHFEKTYLRYPIGRVF